MQANILITLRLFHLLDERLGAGIMQDTFRVSNKNLCEIEIIRDPRYIFPNARGHYVDSDRFSNFVSAPVFSH